jgi:hypothetical protein
MKRLPMTRRTVSMPEDAGGKKQYGSKQREYRIERNSQQPEWEGHEPNERPEDESDDRQRPANHEQDQPK